MNGVSAGAVTSVVVYAMFWATIETVCPDGAAAEPDGAAADPDGAGEPEADGEPDGAAEPDANSLVQQSGYGVAPAAGL